MTKARTVLIIFQIFYELYNNAIHRRFAFYSVYSTAQSEGQSMAQASTPPLPSRKGRPTLSRYHYLLPSRKGSPTLSRYHYLLPSRKGSSLFTPRNRSHSLLRNPRNVGICTATAAILGACPRIGFSLNNLSYP